MNTLKTILDQKGSEIFTVGPKASALDAALKMNEHKVGALVVVEEERVVGIVSERDILRRIVAERQDPGEVPVADIMTREVACGRPETEITEARTVMMKRRIRHLPVVDDDKHLVGIISIGDLNAWELNGQEKTIHYLNEYIHGYR